MYEWIDWDQIPDVINKDRFYRLCRISKSTARYLLQSGTVPCQYTGKKTRCYAIRKEDVQEYLRKRDDHPEAYAAAAGWYGAKKSTGMPKSLSKGTLKKLNSYYTALLISYPDVLSANEIAALTGYCRETVNTWCAENCVPHFCRKRTNYIPKVFLIDFFCSERFRAISKKTKWHVHTLCDFNQRLKDNQRRTTGTKKRG